MRYFLSLLISCIFSSFSLADGIDDEIAAAFKGMPAQDRADSLISFGSNMAASDTAKAFEYLNAALELSGETDYLHGQIRAQYNISQIHYDARRYKEATRHVRLALDILDGDEQYDDAAFLYYRYGHALNGDGKVEEACQAFHNSLRINTAKTDSLGIAMSNRTLGLLFIRTTQYDSSLVYYSIARDYHRALGNDQRVAAMVNSLGAAYYQLGFYEKALVNYQESLEIRRRIKDMSGVSRVLNNIGMLYNKRGNLEDSEKHYSEALRIAEEINDISMIAYSLRNLGELKEGEGDFVTAAKYYEESLNNYRKREERTNITLSLNSVGVIFAKMGDHEKALEFLDEAYALAIEVTYREGMATTLKNMGNVYAAAGNNRKAYDSFERSMNISEKTGNRELHRETLLAISQLAETTGDYKEAMNYFRQYTALNDSLFGEETAKNIDRLRIEHESVRKERENDILRQRQSDQDELLQRNSTIILLISLLLGMAAVFALVLYALYTGKKRANVKLYSTNRKITKQRDEIERKNREFEEALSHIKTLSGLLPICASCKKIRDDDGYWEGVESYITKHSDAMFSHGICPACMVKLYPDLMEQSDLTESE